MPALNFQLLFLVRLVSYTATSTSRELSVVIYIYIYHLECCLLVPCCYTWSRWCSLLAHISRVYILVLLACDTAVGVATDSC